MNGGPSLPNEPRSIADLSVLANDFEWNPSIPLKFWLRAAETIYNESQVYLHEGNISHAYMLLLRYSTLVLDFLGKHPEIKDAGNKPAYKMQVDRIRNVMEQMEKLKPEVQHAYVEWARIRAVQQEQPGRRAPLSAQERFAARDTALSWNPAVDNDILDARLNTDLAIDLASQEMRRRRRQAELTDEEEQFRRTAGVWDDWDGQYQPDEAREEDDLQRQMQSARHKFEGEHTVSHEPSRPRRESREVTSYNYPSIRKSSLFVYETQPSRIREPRALQPPVPGKDSWYRPETPPQRPSKDVPPPYSSSGHERSANETAPRIPPKHDENPKQSKVTFKSASYLENGDPLRSVFLPRTLRKKFLDIAAPNTRRGLETCGILCGTLVNNALFISYLLIPEQTSTPDTCETENEPAMLEFCLANELFVVGWIHTHPTQTCFMSSRDLHTQAGYQLMMPESIAIVCAPRQKPSWGIFRLTNPPGLSHIVQCDASETFHQHSIDNIYTDAQNPPGHVIETDRLPFQVRDLRPGS